MGSGSRRRPGRPPRTRSASRSGSPRRQPPVLAAWALKHLTAGKPDEGLAGDLLEELQGGRSPAWYRRQVAAAVLASWRRLLAQRWTELLFAAVWSSLAPAWEGLVRAGNNPAIARMSHGLGWPGAALCGLILSLSLRLAFVWSGLLLYLSLDSAASGLARWRQLRRGFLRSCLVFAPLWVPLHLLGDILPATLLRGEGPEVLGSGFGPRSTLEILAFFLTTACAIWTDRGALSRSAPAAGQR